MVKIKTFDVWKLLKIIGFVIAGVIFSTGWYVFFQYLNYASGYSGVRNISTDNNTVFVLFVGISHLVIMSLSCLGVLICFYTASRLFKHLRLFTYGKVIIVASAIFLSLYFLPHGFVRAWLFPVFPTAWDIKYNYKQGTLERSEYSSFRMKIRVLEAKNLALFLQNWLKVNDLCIASERVPPTLYLTQKCATNEEIEGLIMDRSYMILIPNDSTKKFRSPGQISTWVVDDVIQFEITYY